MATIIQSNGDTVVIPIKEALIHYKQNAGSYRYPIKEMKIDLKFKDNETGDILRGEVKFVGDFIGYEVTIFEE